MKTTSAYQMNHPEDARELRKYIQKFVSLSEEDWQLLLPHITIRQLDKNELFSREGILSREIGFILEGSMRHYYTHNGQEFTTYFYFENNLVADYISCISRNPSKLNIEALTPCRVLVFPFSILQNLFGLSHNWERFGRLIAEYLAAGLEERMAGLLMLNPEERYLNLIQSHRHKITERIPQQYIASYLGITPVSLSRIRKRITEK